MEKGAVFVTDKGEKSKEYTYIYPLNNGYFDAVIELPISDSIRKLRNNTINRCYTDYGNVTHNTLFVFEIMQELKAIDQYVFWDGGEKWANVNAYEGNYGFAYRKGKSAMISKKGDILTDFKYNGTSNLNSYYSKGKLISVILDKCTGEELFSTKDSIVTYWNPENHLVKHKKNKYYLTYDSKKYEVSKDFIQVKDLPIESTVFTMKGPDVDRKFIDLKSKIVATDLIPLSNVYKGFCIVKEIIKTPSERNFYGEWIPKRDEIILKIVGENFETIKILNGISPSFKGFNKYGLIIMEDHIGYFVMDYLGNYIIQPPRYSNRIEEVFDGLYHIVNYNLEQGNPGKEQTNFYNQKGEKLVEAGWEKSPLAFYESKGVNYIMYHDRVVLTLNKDNLVLKKSF